MMAEPANDKVFLRADNDASLPGPETPGASADFPCSVAQERFWLLDRLDPGNSAYNVAVRWRLEGRVDALLLERAWLTIIERHEILRTLFFETDGVPVQRVLPAMPFKLALIDLSNLPAAHQQSEADRIGLIEARAPFDLGAGPLLRATLLRFSPSMAIILVTTHQIVSDGWSIGIMAREMGVIYEALRNGKPVELTDLSIQYADYSQWQLEWLRVRGTERETDYWSRQLAGVKPFKITPDRPRPAMPTTNGAIVSRVLPRELTTRAQAVSAERGATLFAGALAALCATLGRYAGSEEVTVGTQVSDRDQVELEAMIGQFVNSLVLRNDLSGDPSFAELIDRVAETSAQALDHRHIPIERLLGMIRGERSHANSAPISVNFIFQKTFIQNTAYGDFTLIDMPSLPAGAIYDLNFFMVERPDGWRFSCQFNTDQFEAETAERLLGYFQDALQSGVTDPGRALSQLGLGKPGEARDVLAALNSRGANGTPPESITARFAAQVRRAPTAIAVSGADRVLSYGELDAASSRLAHQLRVRGIAPDTTIAVCLPRGVDVPVALLAVLKMGCAYLLIDPEFPAELRARRFASARVGAVIVAGAQPDDGAIISVDIRSASEITSPVAGLGALSSMPGAGACVWDSSTGKQSPIAWTQGELASAITALAARIGVGERDTVVAVSGLRNGAATLELLLPLLTGARLVIAAQEDLADGETLAGLLQRSGASVLHAAPELWAKLLAAKFAPWPSFKGLCSIAAANPRLVDRLLGLGVELWGLYGAAAVGVAVAATRLEPKQASNRLMQPLAHAAFQIIDSAGGPTLLGATGELRIGRTAAPNEAAYRTGDLARLKAAGFIELLGPREHQFFADGYRIDPTDIEDALLATGQIRESAVVHVPDAAPGESIVAYLVAKEPSLAAGNEWLTELRRVLARSLPPESLPQTYIVRDSLPRQPNQTIDRRALLASQASAQPGAGNGRPVGEIEQKLAEIWTAILRVPSISVYDNFFELGGHSLLAARMLTRVERSFGRRIKLATLFAAPTIQELAAIVGDTDPREFDFRQMVKIQPNGTKTPLISINNTGIYYGMAKRLGADQPVVSLQLFDPSVRTVALPETLEEVAASYVELIRRVQPQGPYALMGWCVAGALAFEIARQLKLAGNEISNLFLIDSWVPQYFRRVGKIRGAIGEYSLRFQLIRADFDRVATGKQGFLSFLRNRMFVKNIQKLIGDQGDYAPGTADSEYDSPETYDRWLLEYLQRVTAHYEPKGFPVRITLLRSRDEPTGWFFKPDAGWQQFTPERVQLHFVAGNHFTMFQEPGVTQLAQYIGAAIDGKIS
jgi:non-ribosomal peptide synthetase component F/thioesterase domain-containing protein